MEETINGGSYFISLFFFYFFAVARQGERRGEEAVKEYEEAQSVMKDNNRNRDP